MSVIQETADSITFELRWVAPQRSGRQTPIEGYDWEFWSSTNPDDPWQTPAASGSTGANDRRAEVTVGFACSAGAVFYVARVRATGNFSSVAPWGISRETVELACDNSPPGPPTVDLDTIPGDTLTTEPDSLVLLPTQLGAVAWNRETQRLQYNALGDTATLCAFAYRDGVGSLAPRGQWVATMDSTVVVVDTDVLGVEDADPQGSACWNLASKANGSAEIFLCTTDCPPTLAGFNVWSLPAWMRAPLLILGFGLLAFGFGADLVRWRRRKAATND
jgi:hypothetical protein